MIVFDGPDIEVAGFGTAFLKGLHELDDALPIGMRLFVDADGECWIDVDNEFVNERIAIFNADWEDVR